MKSGVGDGRGHQCHRVTTQRTTTFTAWPRGRWPTPTWLRITGTGGEAVVRTLASTSLITLSAGDVDERAQYWVSASGQSWFQINLAAAGAPRKWPAAHASVAGHLRLGITSPGLGDALWASRPEPNAHRANALRPHCPLVDLRAGLWTPSRASRPGAPFTPQPTASLYASREHQRRDLEVPRHEPLGHRRQDLQWSHVRILQRRRQVHPEPQPPVDGETAHTAQCAPSLWARRPRESRA